MYSVNYKITSVDNGHMIEVTDDVNEEPTILVAREDDEDETSSFVSFLNDILNRFGPSTGRYSEKRIRIVVLPGDKRDDPVTDPAYREDLQYLKDCCEYALREKTEDEEA